MKRGSRNKIIEHMIIENDLEIETKRGGGLTLVSFMEALWRTLKKSK